MSEKAGTLPLVGRVAVVTGGGRGIGAAIAAKLASLGATTIIVGRTPGPLESTARQIWQGGGRCEPVPCDVSDWQSVEGLRERVNEKWGAVTVLVNNAGIGSFAVPLHLLPPEQWDAVINTNLRGPYYCKRAFVPGMIAAGRGDIINISSLAGKNPLPNGAAYGASKWGLNGMSYSVAEELRAHNIRVAV
ncbi:MAG TPA: SDR family oxidoreductase, partial [Terriglobales bacterium]|nr:SDR family oxidoreductase [Terriglobales bacterium]